MQLVSSAKEIEFWRKRALFSALLLDAAVHAICEHTTSSTAQISVTST